jgi:phosphatidylglycerophosphate synthase
MDRSLTTTTPSGRQRPSVAATAGLFALLGAALALALWSGGGRAGGALAILLFVAIALIALARIGPYHPFSKLGLANAVTAFRAALVCLLAALVHDESVALLAFALTVVALALDGVDGWLARRSGLASRFGARFDMEVDALLVLVLSAAAFAHAKAGIWVLLLGLMRYLFVLASFWKPQLAGDLPPSRRRQTVCVAQIAALAILLLPGLGPPASSAIAAAALVALTWSFVIDIRHLLGRSA